MGDTVNNTWIIGDTHFYDENIIVYERRPFNDINSMNKAMIDNWNSKVKSDDKIFILGDFALCSEYYIEKLVKQLNGYKMLVLGNHDVYSCQSYLKLGFDEVYSYPIIVDNFYMLSHEPLYINRNMPYANIFSHVHGNPAFTDVSDRTFCVSVERKKLNYSPIKFSTVKEEILKSHTNKSL